MKKFVSILLSFLINFCKDIRRYKDIKTKQEEDRTVADL